MKESRSDLQNTLFHLIKTRADKRLWAESLLRIARAAKNSRGENRIRELARLETEIVEELTRDFDDRQIHSQTLMVNRDFVMHLKQQYPDLTENELLLSCFFRMNLPLDTIASLKGISQASLNVARSRLKNKLGLTEGQNLNEYLQEIS